MELKGVDRFANVHSAQCINYLKSSGLRVALLITRQEVVMLPRRGMSSSLPNKEDQNAAADELAPVHDLPSGPLS